MIENRIQMVDLGGQYKKIKNAIDIAIQDVIDTMSFINGPAVNSFADDLKEYLSVDYVIPCANGTDALQIALMALDLNPGDEVIVPCFTYVATAEVIGLLRLKPVLVEVDPDSFNITSEIIERAITSRTKAIVPVHLYGQCVDMEKIMELALKNNLFVIEDTAQALGASYFYSTGNTVKAGTIGHIGCTSFFPSKNLGCYGDGGAIFTKSELLYRKMQMIANHGQSQKYHHDVIGCNSRLDSIQAAILKVKLPFLNEYALARMKVADYYDEHFVGLDWLKTPFRSTKSTHVFHQYTLKVKNNALRDEFKIYLAKNGISSMIYYPIPLHLQTAFRSPANKKGDFPISEDLCDRVISLPIHTEMTIDQLDYITKIVKNFN